MSQIVILGSGPIGRATKIILRYPSVIIDEKDIDIARCYSTELADKIKQYKAKIVINALPFQLTVKAAEAALLAGCDYIDYTEDAQATEKVKGLYRNSERLAMPQCGLAPGFINYVGVDLASQFEHCERLLICVGALPRCVNYDYPSRNYAMSWSVDGLVNEYLEDVHVRRGGREVRMLPLEGIENVVINGIQYEAAHTAGAVGSLLEDLKDVPNVEYKTLRYPGHFEWLKQVCSDLQYDHNRIKEHLLNVMYYDDDILVTVYAEAVGKIGGRRTRKTFARNYKGWHNLSAIQATTAGAACAIAEMHIEGLTRFKGVLNHADVDFKAFQNTSAFRNSYRVL